MRTPSTEGRGGDRGTNQTIKIARKNTEVSSTPFTPLFWWTMGKFQPVFHQSLPIPSFLCLIFYVCAVGEQHISMRGHRDINERTWQQNNTPSPSPSAAWWCEISLEILYFALIKKYHFCHEISTKALLQEPFCNPLLLISYRCFNLYSRDKSRPY